MSVFTDIGAGRKTDFNILRRASGWPQLCPSKLKRSLEILEVLLRGQDFLKIFLSSFQFP
jgi:hypothetical protein